MAQLFCAARRARRSFVKKAALSSHLDLPKKQTTRAK
jgi:hypothetical protein